MLTGDEIIYSVKNDDITIHPFNLDQVNPNSYDIRIGGSIFEVKDSNGNGSYVYPTLEKQTGLNRIFIDKGKLYLCSTIEIVGSYKYIPMIDGKSTLARLGVAVHLTAGIGDIGFINKWTLEITSLYPIYLYVGMRIGQFYFIEPYGNIRKEHVYKGFYSEINNRHHLSNINKIIENDSNLIKYNSLNL